MTVEAKLGACAHEARYWLFNAAALLWATTGVQTDGLFAEAIDHRGEAVKKTRRMKV